MKIFMMKQFTFIFWRFISYMFKIIYNFKKAKKYIFSTLKQVIIIIFNSNVVILKTKSKKCCFKTYILLNFFRKYMRDSKTLESEQKTFGYFCNQPLSCTKRSCFYCRCFRKIRSNKYYVCYPFMIHREILLLYFSTRKACCIS